MAKLHQLLAIKDDLKNAGTKIINETIATFTKREGHFKAFTRKLELFDEKAVKPPVERKAMSTSVAAKLKYQRGHIIRFMDALLQLEATNQTAKADIVINDKTIAEAVPVTFLLNLEKTLKQLQMIYNVIPTLPPEIDWKQDPTEGDDIYKRTFPEEKFKTEQTIVPQILYEATEHHPAQVDKISEVRNVGLYVKNEWCSMLSVSVKSHLLANIDQLLRAVKKARQRANNAQIVKCSIGEKLFNFIHG